MEVALGRKPRLFIGSSAEALDIAYTAQEILERYAEVTVWDQGLFGVSQGTLEALLDVVDRADCGLFVFAPDDIVRIRGAEHASARDNVVFELGLFVGRLGKDRSFILMPTEPEVRLPTDLLGITPARFDPRRDDRNLKAALGPACNRVQRVLLGISRSPRHPKPIDPSRVSREQFASRLLRALGDKRVETVRCVTYTAEVDQGLINQFHVSGPKKIEIYKRSPLADLVEEQSWNLKRIAQGIKSRLWRKRAVSTLVSQRLAAEAEMLKRRGVDLVQYLYEGPPSKRAYIFDDEVIVAFYQVVDALQEEGSVYQGMTDAPAVIVRPTDAQWDFTLAELEHYLAGLRRNSRTWEQEASVLLNGGPWVGHGKRPCIHPKAAFFDVDGVLLDSLPLYVSAWTTAFREEGLEFPLEIAYLEEGRRGRETILNHLDRLGIVATPEMVQRIRERRQDALKQLGAPPALDGARDLVRKVTESGLSVWAVTGSSDPSLRSRLLEHFDGLIAPDRVITGEDTNSGKPSAEPYLLACARANVNSHDAIAIENAPLGVRSADQAGVFCIAVNTGPLDTRILDAAGARVVFASCRALADSWAEVLSVLTDYSTDDPSGATSTTSRG